MAAGHKPDASPLGDEAVIAWRALAACIRPHLLGAWLVLSVGLLAGCDDRSEATPAAAAPPPAVSVVEVAPQDVTPSTQFVGRVAALDKVDLRARVTGFLEQGSSSLPRALFVEGGEVNKGDLLYVIEQPPFQAQVAAAKAQVAQAEATVAEANATLQRVQEAVKSGAVSKQELDQATAAAQEGQAQVLVAEAQLQTAEINLGYTEIYAPISGKIGLTSVHLRQSGRADQRRARDDRQPGPDLRHLSGQRGGDRPGAGRGQRHAAARADSFVVRVELPDGTIYAQPGKIDFLSNQVDQTTDTLTVRAAFANPRAPSGRRPVRHGDRRDSRAGDGAGRAAAGRADRPGGLLRPGGGQRRQGRAAARHAGVGPRHRASWCRAA